jgi:hypothetical protein
MERVGLYLQDAHDLRSSLEWVRNAEKKGTVPSGSGGLSSPLPGKRGIALG